VGFFSDLFTPEYERVNKEIYENFLNRYSNDETLKAYCDLFDRPLEDIMENISSGLKRYLKDSSFFDVDMTIGDEIAEEMVGFILSKYLVSNDYLDPLILKYKQLIYIDSYGDIDESDFEKELVRFVKKREDAIVNTVFESDILDSANPDQKLTCLSNVFLTFELNRLVKDYISSNDISIDNTSNVDIEDPYEYEQHIANVFSSLGWDAYATSGSGDQGADVIAEKNGLKFVIQCKLYSKPVGNKAVQEVTSARDYYNAAGSVVVSNQSYTKSAMQLAESQNVWLLNDTQIEDFNHKMDDHILSYDED